MTTIPNAESSRSVSGGRLRFIDVLRGFVIVLMALDHTRDMFHFSGYAYDPLDAALTTPGIFITRWITHLCAPTFILLAGASAWLQHDRGKSTPSLSRFLLTRGLWLIFLEATVISFGWAFSFPYLIFFQVMWAIGCAMIALAALVWLPRVAVLGVGIVIVAGHNLLDRVPPAIFGHFPTLWAVLHTGGQWPQNNSAVLLMTYPVLAWAGVMALGYGIGPLFVSRLRNRLFLVIGPSLLALFFGLRFLNVYGDPHPWTIGATPVQTAMHFFNVQKYPPSLLYLSVTLGLACLLATLFDRWRGRFTEVLRMFGSVPLFAYILHVYLLHAANVVLLVLTHHPTLGTFDQTRTAFLEPEKLAGSGFTLPVIFAVWIGVLVLLYPLCRWWASLKSRNRFWWMSYL
jgi:uncharacterized membrane protein